MAIPRPLAILFNRLMLRMLPLEAGLDQRGPMEPQAMLSHAVAVP